MKTISITYTVKWQLSKSPNYVWTKDHLCFNLKTGKQIKQVYKNGMIGYCINSKFISLKKLRTQLELIKEEKTPF